MYNQLEGEILKFDQCHNYQIRADMYIFVESRTCVAVCCIVLCSWLSNHTSILPRLIQCVLEARADHTRCHLAQLSFDRLQSCIPWSQTITVCMHDGWFVVAIWIITIYYTFPFCSLILQCYFLPLSSPHILWRTYIKSLLKLCMHTV